MFFVSTLNRKGGVLCSARVSEALKNAKIISFGQYKLYKIRFLYELKHKVHPYKTVRGIFHFRFHFDSFLLKFILMFNNVYKINKLILFKIKRIENPETILLPGL